jgi:TonB-linked SusC/RagA family outer membrane protein
MLTHFPPRLKLVSSIQTEDASLILLTFNDKYMKKNRLRFYSHLPTAFIKVLTVMKLTVLFIVLGICQTMANAKAQEKVTLNVSREAITKVLNSIEKQGYYRFVYNSNLEDLKQKISADFKEAGIADVLKTILSGTTLSYNLLEDNLIVIRENETLKQDITVTGKVSDANGAALAGASVTIKGTSKGVTTDAGGNFSISAPERATLVISSVGYKTQEVAVNNRTTIDVYLEASSTQQLNEVVVIGYGTANKRDLTGSIVKVAGKDVADKPNTNPVASLQGKVSGLMVINSGKPGQEPDIRLRGTLSRTQTKPLFIVDGIFTDNIDFVNPNDIESMEILKDASSLAIFGVKGANGAILVTTKKGKTGQIIVNFNTSIGVQKIVDKIALVDAAGYKTLLTEQFANQGTAPYQYFNLYNGNSDWQDLISQNGLINVNNVSVTSGTEKNRFYMSLGYTTQEGIIKNENLRRITLTMNDELKISKAVKIGFNITGYQANLPQLRDFGNAIAAAPIVEPFNNTYGVYNQMPFNLQSAQVDNPLRVVEGQKNTAIAKNYRAVGSVFGEVNFLKDFTFRATYYADISFNNSRSYTPLVNVYNAVEDTVVNTNPKTSVAQKDNMYSKFQQDYLLTYKKQFGEHGLTLMAGFSTIYNSYHETNGNVSQFTTGNAIPIPNDKRFWYLDNFLADPTSRTLITPEDDLFGNPLPYEWQQTTVSYFARALYNYKGKYLLNASFRRDGSSDISPNDRYQNFAAAGVAWDLSQEDFMKNQSIFDLAKIKASWGVLGNQYTAIHYPYYPLLTAAGSAIFGPNGEQQVLSAFTPSFIADPNLKWETITATDLGVEFAVLRNRLRVEAGYYKKVTNDLLTNYPSLNGQKPGITNAGKITNSGIELSASWSENYKNSFGYTVSGNLTTFKNVVNSVFEEGYEIFDGPTRTRAGDPIGAFYGYVVDGIYQSAADSANSPNNGYRPGDFKFKDINGDKKIDQNDRTTIGNPTPKFTYGFSFSVTYKGFDAGMDFQGVSGNQIFRNWGNGVGYARLNYRAARLNRWHGEGTSNWEPWVNDNSTASFLNSSYMIESGTYLRIRNAQIGYTFNQSMLAKAKIKSLRIYVSGQNLKTFKHNSGYTPEFGGSALQFGVDAGSYPVPAIYTAGLNVSF